MDITQLLTGATGSTGTGMNISDQQNDRDYSNFKDYMNTFIDASNSVKNKAGVQDDYTQVKDFQPDVKFKAKNQSAEDSDFEDEEVADSSEINAFPVQPLSPEEKEAFERIAVMISDGGLDGQSLEELDEDQLAELVDWVLAGAGGLFPVYQPDSLENSLSAETGMENDLFGLSRSVEALQQLEELYGRISQENSTESDVAMVGKLVDLDSMDSMDVDKLAQAVLDLAGEYADTSEESGLDGENSNLRELLARVPADKLENVIKDVLQEISPETELPDMPESVLKSLSIEIINVNNGILDAAQMRSQLLDGLSNNSQLREEILSSMSAEESGQELLAAVDLQESAEPLSDNVLEDLAEAVLEDSNDEAGTADKQNLIETENEDDSGTLLATNDLENADEQNETVVLNTAEEADNTEKYSVETAKSSAEANADSKTDKAESAVMQQSGKEENSAVKVTVQEEVASSQKTGNTEETKTDNNENTNLKDSLTGKSFKEEKSTGQEFSGQQSAEENSDKKKDITRTELSSGLLENDESGLEGGKSSLFNEHFSDIENKADFKIFTPDNNQNNYVNENPNVRYSDVIENMEKIEKLLAATSDKTLKSVTLEFSPPELGKLTIDVSVKNGSATASLKVESDSARNMLLSNVEQLKKNLESHGIKLENFEVELNKQDQQDRNQQSTFAQAQQQEQERRARQGNRSGRNRTANAGSGGSQEADAEAKKTNTIGEDGSVDIVA